MNTAIASQNSLNQKLLSYFIYHKPLQREECVAMHTLQDGQLVFEQGHLPLGVYYILKGKVKFSCFAQNGTHHIFHIATDGDFLGYKCAIINKRYGHSAIAWGEVSYYFIPYKLFKNVLDTNFNAASKFCKLLCEDLVETEERLVALSRMAVKARLANTLLTLRKHVNGNATIAIPRLELAHMIGTATETVIRMLSEFNQEKLIDTSKRGEIKILDEQRLHRLTMA